MEVVVSYIVPVIHVLSCLFLIVVVLLQTGKGADMGAVFGGGSQTLFGSGGAGNLLTRLTTGTAIAFMITSLILTWGQSRGTSSALLDKVPFEAAVPADVPPPAAAPAPAEGQPNAAAPTPPAPEPNAAAPTPPAPPTPEQNQ